MLEGLKRRGNPAPEPVSERDLREEREALTVTQLETRVAAMETRTGTAARQLSDVETAAAAVGTLAEKIRDLSDHVRDARQTADRLTAPDGDLHQQRHIVQQLMSQALQSRATLDTLAAEQERMDALRADLRRTTDQMQQARLLVSTTTTEIETVRAAAADAKAAQAQMRELATRAEDDVARVVSVVHEVDQKLQSAPRDRDGAQHGSAGRASRCRQPPWRGSRAARGTHRDDDAPVERAVACGRTIA